MPNRQEFASKKRIIICADGTWNASDMGKAGAPSNVARIARAIAPTGVEKGTGKLVKQIVAYFSGLGAGDLPLQKLIYGGIGWGLEADVCQIYDFICNNYEKDDELFFFGFSRGAFTVRSVAGLICDVGVLSAVQMPHFAKMWEAYRANLDGQSFRNTTWYLGNKATLGLSDDIKVKVVGVWDTVGALGIPAWRWVSWLGANKKYKFHNTKVSKNLEYAFQALALDERRKTFPPTLWHKTNDGPAVELQQCWFPGVHGDIGGFTDGESGDFEKIGDVTFAWMVDNLSEKLTFEDAAIQAIVDQHRRTSDSCKKHDGWGCGTIIDNFDSVKGWLFGFLGKQNRTPGNYLDPDVKTGEIVGRTTNELFHPITRLRKRQRSDWSPPSLEAYTFELLTEELTSKQVWKWRKTQIESLPEYVIEKGKQMSVAYEENGSVRYKTAVSLSRRLCPKNVILDLDRDNQIA